MEELIKWGAYALAGIVAWYVNKVWEKQEKMQDVIAAQALHISETYVKKDELRTFSEAIFKKLDKLETLMIGHLTQKDD